jgi:DNA invertase Pin-like site-specific DNA recombinase
MNESEARQGQDNTPKKPRSKNRKRQYFFNLALTAEEDATLRAKALKAGKKPGELLRAWIKDKEIKAAHPEDYYRTLRNIGGNLNQIAKHLNSGAIPTRKELEEVIILCGDVHKNASR